MPYKNKIKALRKAKGITQIKLCEYLSIAQPTLSGYETNSYEPDFEMAVKLADYFDVSVDYLLGRETKEKPSTDYGESFNEFQQTLDKLGLKDNLEEQKKLLEKINTLSYDQKKLILQMIDNFKDKSK